MQNFSYENEFDLHENGRVDETHFHKNSLARRLILTQKQTRTRKWAILLTWVHMAHCLVGTERDGLDGGVGFEP